MFFSVGSPSANGTNCFTHDGRFPRGMLGHDFPTHGTFRVTFFPKQARASHFLVQETHYVMIITHRAYPESPPIGLHRSTTHFIIGASNNPLPPGACRQMWPASRQLSGFQHCLCRPTACRSNSGNDIRMKDEPFHERTATDDRIEENRQPAPIAPATRDSERSEANGLPPRQTDDPRSPLDPVFFDPAERL
jgi:hypothetical protein